MTDNFLVMFALLVWLNVFGTAESHTVACLEAKDATPFPIVFLQFRSAKVRAVGFPLPLSGELLDKMVEVREMVK